MTDKNKKTSIGPTLPAGLGKDENVNGGLPINDPRSPDIAAQGAGYISEDQKNPPKLVIDEETGEILTDAPKPVRPKAPKMRVLETRDGPDIDPETNAYRPAIYPVRRMRERKDGTVSEHVVIRQDN